MKYGVAVVSPRVAIRSVLCFSIPPGQMGVWLGVSFYYIYLSVFFWGGGVPFLQMGGFFPWALHTHTHTHTNVPARLGLKKDIRAEPVARTTRSGIVKGTCPG